MTSFKTIVVLYVHYWSAQIIKTRSTCGLWGSLLLLPDQSFHLLHEAQAQLILPGQGDALHRYGQTLTSRHGLNTHSDPVSYRPTAVFYRPLVATHGTTEGLQ